jgi:hypothetical protein
LWTTFEIVPGSGADTGDVTAHWVEIDTSTLASPAIADQGNAGAEDIATDAYTYFPSISVDQCGNMALGFAASASSIDAGAYYANRYASDTAGTLQSTGTLATGLGGYVIIDSIGRNRWGDYTGMALDPESEAAFLVYNEYAGSSNNWLTRYGIFPSGLDFGDLPAVYSNTLNVDDGARHCIDDVFLGSGVDPDINGQESVGAGDDDATDTDDEDGVSRVSPPLWANNTSVDVDFDLSSSAGPVDIGLWIDWNGNDAFDSGTDFFSFTGVAAGGISTQSITVPGAGTYTVGNALYVRARVFPSGGAPGGTLDASDSTGLARNGEVEDYFWSFSPTALSFTEAASSEAPTTIVLPITIILIFFSLGLYAYIHIRPRAKGQ